MADEKKYLDQEGLAKLWELISDNFEDIDSHQLDIEELRALIESVDAKTDTTVSTKLAELEAKVDANKDETDAAIEAKIAEVVDGAPEAFDTLKEIAEYVSSDDGRTLDLIERVNDLEQIKALTEEEIEEICARVAITTKVADAAEFKAAMASNGIVKLTQNMTLDEAVSVAPGADVTLDLNGKKLTVAGNNFLNANGGKLTIENGSVSSAGRIGYAANGGTLTIKDATLESGDVALQATGEGSKLVIESGDITAQECGALVTTEAAFEMNGGTITSIDNAAIMGNGTVKPGNDQGHVEINFNGGELNCGITSAGYSACGIYMPNSGVLNVRGGVINVEKGCGILMRAGKLNMTGGEIHCSDNSGVEGGFIGKVGDSRVVVPCAAVVFDDKAAYPGLANGEFGGEISGGVLESAPGLDDIVFVSDDPSKISVIDNREETQTLPGE